MTHYLAATGIISTLIAVFLWFHACIYLTIATQPLFPNSQYAVAYNEKTGVYHAYLMDNGVPKDPQLLFLSLSPSVDYQNPELLTDSVSELLKRTYTWGRR